VAVARCFGPSGALFLGRRRPLDGSSFVSTGRRPASNWTQQANRPSLAPVLTNVPRTGLGSTPAPSSLHRRRGRSDGLCFGTGCDARETGWHVLRMPGWASAALDDVQARRPSRGHRLPHDHLCEVEQRATLGHEARGARVGIPFPVRHWLPSGWIKTECGNQVWQRSVGVGVRFPAMEYPNPKGPCNACAHVTLLLGKTDHSWVTWGNY
jgi:hypothetical protein